MLRSDVVDVRVVDVTLLAAELVDADHPELREVPAGQSVRHGLLHRSDDGGPRHPEQSGHDVPGQQRRPLRELHHQGPGQRALADRPRDHLHLRAPAARARYPGRTVAQLHRDVPHREMAPPPLGTPVPYPIERPARRAGQPPPADSVELYHDPAFSPTTASTRWFLSPSVVRMRLPTCTCPSRLSPPSPGGRRTEGARHFKDLASAPAPILERSPDLKVRIRPLRVSVEASRCLK